MPSSIMRRERDRRRPLTFLPRAPWTFVAIAFALAMLTSCEHKPTKEEEEAAKNTFVCQLAGERLLIRFDSGEARMLTSTAEKITLYQIPSASGVRYSNGTVELRGKGADLVMIENGASTTLDGCKPMTVPKAK